MMAIAVGRNSPEQAPLSAVAAKRCQSCSWPARPIPSGRVIASSLKVARKAMRRTRFSRSESGEPSRRISSSGMLELRTSAPMASLESVSSETSHPMARSPKVSPKVLKDRVASSP
ncbi:hypothetical protein D3C81_1633750 [compost metagenome]